MIRKLKHIITSGTQIQTVFFHLPACSSVSFAADHGFGKVQQENN